MPEPTRIRNVSVVKDVGNISLKLRAVEIFLHSSDVFSESPFAVKCFLVLMPNYEI